MSDAPYQQWLLHAFSLDMLGKSEKSRLIVEPVEELPRAQTFRVAVGQEVVAKLIAQHMDTPEDWQRYHNPATVLLVPGDVAYVARFRGTWPGPGQSVALTGTNLDLWRVTVVPN